MVKIRKYRRRGVATGEWEVDVRVELPSGVVYRDRKLYRDASSRAEARAWGEDRQEHIRGLVRQGMDLDAIRRALRGQKVEGPTLREFWPDFIEGYVRANREKFSSLRSRESIYREHFAPWYDLPLSAITDEEVQKLKGRLSNRAAKTTNNVLTCLSVVLKTAVAWKRLGAMPCSIKLVKVDTAAVPEFYEDDEFERLVTAASADSPEAKLVVLLGGDAGLRKGEIIALEWDDLDLARGQVVVRRAEYRGAVGAPKGSKTRVVPTTARLRAALGGFRHLRGARLFYRPDGTTVSEEWVRGVIKRVEKRAGLPVTKGKCHKLRHTFCTRLAMAGAAPRTIQALAGHVSIETTMRYMHVAKAAPAQAIAALDARVGGGVVEAVRSENEKLNETAK